MKSTKYTIESIVKWFIPFYFFIALPLHAQVGTWKNYLL